MLITLSASAHVSPCQRRSATAPSRALQRWLHYTFCNHHIAFNSLHAGMQRKAKFVSCTCKHKHPSYTVLLISCRGCWILKSSAGASLSWPKPPQPCWSSLSSATQPLWTCSARSAAVMTGSRASLQPQSWPPWVTTWLISSACWKMPSSRGWLTLLCVNVFSCMSYLNVMPSF